MSIVDEHIRYVEEYKVVICRTCRYCIRPGGSYDHFRLWHKDLGLPVRKELQSHCDSLDLANPKDVRVPTDGATIDDLALYTGRRCTIPACGALCVKESQAIKHARGHGWVVGRPKTWETCKVQVRTFILF
jgi:hypothetical protein